MTKMSWEHLDGLVRDVKRLGNFYVMRLPLLLTAEEITALHKSAPAGLWSTVCQPTAGLVPEGWFPFGAYHGLTLCQYEGSTMEGRLAALERRVFGRWRAGERR